VIETEETTQTELNSGKSRGWGRETAFYSQLSIAVKVLDFDTSAVIKTPFIFGHPQLL
jgi:hypothetical protein